MKTTLQSLTLACALALTAQAHAAVSHFDDLTLAPNSFWAGVPTPSGNTTSFTSGPATYFNTATDFGGGFTSWDGWAYSNTADTTTAGFGNQYSAITGDGHGAGQDNYGVTYYSSSSPNPSHITFSGATTVTGAWFTNTTYAYLSMRDGDAFSKKFGGASGNDADWFSVTVTGINGAATTGSADFYLADFRFADNGQDYLVNQWTWMDLSPLGLVTDLRLSFASSDVGMFGINTPTYVAIDDLTAVPLPAGLWLLGSGLAVFGWAGRRR